MKLDIKTLQTFHKMAQKGAEEAAERLEEMTGQKVAVDKTKVKFVNRSQLAHEIDPIGSYVGVSVELDGGPGGHSVILYGDESAAEITDSVLELTKGTSLNEYRENEDTSDTDLLLSGTPRSVITEIGNMMNCGYIDGWANVLQTEIDVSPPFFHAGQDGMEVFRSLDSQQDVFDMGDENQLILMFQSEMQLVDTEFSFKHVLLPSVDELEKVLAQDRELVNPFDYEKLIGFDEMVEQGANEAANSMEALTGRDTEVEIHHLNFVRVDSIPQEVEGEDAVGIGFTYDGMPSGYLLFVFGRESAAEIARDLLPTDPDDPFGDLGQSALKELGNIMASGVLDGWANVLGTMIEHSPPNYFETVEGVLEPITEQVGAQQDYAFVFDTTINAEDREYDCSIFSVCEEGDLEQALNDLNVDDLHKAQKQPDFPIEQVEQSEGEIDTDGL